MAELETFDVDDKEIMSAGTWRTASGRVVTIDSQFLDNIVNAFTEIPYKIPMKLGHAENQKLLQEDGYPSAGWVKSLKRVGNKILASFAKVPKVIKNLIDAGAYATASPEVVTGYKEPNTGKEYPHFMSAVALLGHNLPAMNTLQSWTNLYEGQFAAPKEAELLFSGYPDIDKITEPIKLSQEKEEVKKMDEKQMQELQAKADEFKADAEAKAVELKAVQDKFAALEETRKAELLARKKLDCSAYLEGKVKDGKMLPKQTAFAEVILMNAPEDKFKFSADGKEQEVSVAEAFKSFMEGLPELVKFSEIAESKKGDDSESDKYAGANPKGIELHEFALEISKEKKIGYIEALKLASKEHPELVTYE